MEIPIEVRQILATLQKSGFQAFIVGGAVRDLLMGKIVTDWDFTTDATPEEILKIFPEGFYDNKFGTVGIKSEGSIFEITTMRKEGLYRDSRHPEEVFWTTNLREDLARRDFTVNAMALGLATSNINNKLSLNDPFSGQKDLKNKLIKAVGNPDLRFQEDALRLIRAIRIASELEFEIEKDTFSATVKNAQLIKNIASERVRDELLKLLAGMNPYIGIIKLREVGILQIILPELEKCFGVLQEGPKHARVYDIGEHSLLTLKHTTSNEPITLLAALLHDIGKPNTAKVEKDGNVTFYQHDVVGGRLVLQIAKRFNLSRKYTDKLYKLVRWHLFTVDEKQTDSAIRRFIKNIGVENIEDMLTLRVGDRLGGGTEKAISWRMEEFRKRIAQVLEKPFSIADLKINGTDVMEVLDIPPSRKVGEVLDKLLEEVLADDSKNNSEYLLEAIKKYK